MSHIKLLSRLWGCIERDHTRDLEGVLVHDNLAGLVLDACPGQPDDAGELYWNR